MRDCRYVYDMAPHWDELQRLAELREAQKANYRSRMLNKKGSTHFFGLLGEKAYSLHAGLPMDSRLLICGDKGDDFPDGTDVKTRTHGDPYLLHPANKAKWPRARFVLAFVGIPEKKVYLLGWASVEELRAAPTKDFPGTRHGPGHAIHWRALRRMWAPIECGTQATLYF